MLWRWDGDGAGTWGFKGCLDWISLRCEAFGFLLVGLKLGIDSWLHQGILIHGLGVLLVPLHTDGNEIHMVHLSESRLPRLSLFVSVTGAKFNSKGKATPMSS